MRVQSSLPASPPSANEGFTVIELLVVVAMIAFSVGLVLPALQVGQENKKRLDCSNNLHQIGICYHVFIDQNGNKTSAFVGDTNWVSRLLPYLDGEVKIFVCPSDDRKGVPAPPAGGLPDVAIRDTARKQDVRLSKDNFFWKQLDATTMGLDFDFAKSGKFDAEVTLQITTQADGIKIKMVDRKKNGNQLSLLGPNGEMLVEKFDLGKASTSTYIIKTPPRTSYGVNNAAKHFAVTADSEKVLALDYHKSVAGLVQIHSNPPLDVWPTTCAPRHSGDLNVLFRDGSVQSMTPFGEIDPRIKSIYKEKWVPEMLLR